ncbi:MAG: KamA family radical SAM protein [Candidatus Poribacteria bacterium]|nr:KamA family radical SAM protein [Candidatus Poribacteria bacterium]MDE0506576.1 KamA family radical SAM protein [Candidatus Poribacteria bacterium]
MEEWKRLVRDTVDTPEKLAAALDVDIEMMRKIHEEFPIRINPYYLSLIEEIGDPIWKQVVPDSRELIATGVEDPLHEEEDSEVANVTHRYPDRVLFYVNYMCPIYCRFCTRKRKVGDPDSIPDDNTERGLKYLREHSEVRDVIISGGDPLMLTDRKIDYIVSGLRSIDHIEIIRIGSRVPVTLPQRITPELCTILKKNHPFYINTHFNHPREITPETTEACGMLADAGIPLGNQAVLLRGVNDDPEIMVELMKNLLAIRVKPYYIYQADLVVGTDHFRTSIKKGLEIIEALRGHISGLGVPHYVVDAPGGGGKIALLPDPVVSFDDDEIRLKNYEGGVYSYPSTPFYDEDW